MPWVLGLYVIGGLSISGIPLFAGFVSKGIVIDAAGYGGYETIMLVLLVASVGTWLSVGLKLPYFTWFDKSDYEGELKPIPVNMYIAMGVLAFACVFYGIFPNALYAWLPHTMDYEPYTVYHLVEITQIALLTFVVFWWMKKKLAPELTTVLDLDWFYRKAAPATRLVFVQNVNSFFAKVEDGIQNSARFFARHFQNPMRWLNPLTDDKNEAKSYSPSMEVVMSFILLGFLVFAVVYFF
jgi:multicomponent Na+:H+ antiporter subunit D